MILIAIGANLPTFDGSTARMTCERAAEAISKLPGMHRTIMSRWFESAPVPPSGQPPYVNGVVRIDGPADPAALLEALQVIEDTHGRMRSIPNAARTLDLDIIAIDDIVRAAPDPILPHPRMHERAFVLLPLLDVAPDWIHPILGIPARTLLARLLPQQVAPLAPVPLRGSPLHLT